MTMPSIIGAGAGVTDATSGTFATITPAAPASGVEAGDILILHAAARANTSVDSITLDGAFTTMGSFRVGTSNNLGHVWGYKLCTGSEDGATFNVDGTSTGAAPRISARIYQFRSIDQTTPVNNAAGIDNNGTSASPGPGVSNLTTTTGEFDRRGIYLAALRGTGTLGSITGETTGNWVQPGAPDPVISSYQATNLTIQLQTAQVPNPLTLNGGSSSFLGGSVPWVTRTFTIIGSTTQNIPGRVFAVRQAVRRASFR